MFFISIRIIMKHLRLDNDEKSEELRLQPVQKQFRFSIDLTKDDNEEEKVEKEEHLTPLFILPPEIIVTIFDTLKQDHSVSFFIVSRHVCKYFSSLFKVRTTLCVLLLKKKNLIFSEI